MAEYKPSDVFLGVIEFFAILLPGVACTFLVFLLLGENLIKLLFEPVLCYLDNEPKQWIAFLFSSYIVGHFLLSLGELVQCAREKWFRIKRSKKYGYDLCLDRAKQVALRYHFDWDGKDLFYWAGSVVRAVNPAASAEIDRRGAEYKFFRSLVFVFIVACVLFWVHGAIGGVVVSVVLAVFSFLRFLYVCFIHKLLTYEYFVILDYLSPPSSGDLKVR